MTDIFSELSWRGLVHQTTADDEIGGWLKAKMRTVYAGFDPTADSLHVGSLLPLMMLRRFQKAGHRPIAIAGGATGMIGDPSGKSAERNLLSSDQLAQNLAGIEGQMRKLLDFESGDNAAVLVNNNDWMSKFSYTDFLRDVGKNFPVNVMLAKDSVKSRLSSEAGLSYTEFSYMLLQAYDFVHLNQEFGCEMQIGGSDQWGNVTAGIDLGRRMHGLQLYGLTCPLLTKSDGSKMGKTESGAIWLCEKRTSPYALYQYWINVDDSDVSKCLRFLTELDEEEIKALDKSREEDPGLNESQKRLAEEVTKLIHGGTGLSRAEKATAFLFKGSADMNDSEMRQIVQDVGQKIEIGADGLSILDALTELRLCNSKGEARRAIKENSVHVSDSKVSDIEYRINKQDGVDFVIVRRGKKKRAVLRFA